MLFLSLARLILLKKTGGFLFTRRGVTFPDSLPKEMGLYLHIPFCHQICSFCPYNKILFNKNLALKYESALLREIDFYKKALGNSFLNSLYIGGGTPTTMVNSLGNIIKKIKKNLNLGNEIGIEVHPNDVNTKTLQKRNILKPLRPNYLSPWSLN